MAPADEAGAAIDIGELVAELVDEETDVLDIFMPAGGEAHEEPSLGM